MSRFMARKSKLPFEVSAELSAEAKEHMDEVQRRTNSKKGIEDSQKFSANDKFHYNFENYVSADDNAMFKILICVTLVFTVAFGIVWAILDNAGTGNKDWILHGADGKVWFTFQILATQGYDDASGRV